MLVSGFQKNDATISEEIDSVFPNSSHDLQHRLPFAANNKGPTRCRIGPLHVVYNTKLAPCGGVQSTIQRRRVAKDADSKRPKNKRTAWSPPRLS